MNFTSKRIVFALFLITALIFLALLNARPYPYDYLLKAIPVIILCAFAFFSFPGVKGKLMTLGFLFSAIGDIILELDTGSLFVFGLCAFLVAHLFYIASFIQKKKTTKPRRIISSCILIYGICLGGYLFPYLGDMQIPVMIYLCIIMGMGISAAIGGDNHPLTIAGACFFILSDSLIAVNRFLFPIPASSLFIMTTYYSGQLFIAAGVSWSVAKKISYK